MPYTFKHGPSAISALKKLNEELKLAKETYLKEHKGKENSTRTAQFDIIMTTINTALKATTPHPMGSDKNRLKVVAGAIFHVRMAIAKEYSPKLKHAYTEMLTTISNSKLFSLLGDLELLNQDAKDNPLDQQAIQSALKAFLKYYQVKCHRQDSNLYAAIEGIELKQFEDRLVRWATGYRSTETLEEDKAKPFDESYLIDNILPKKNEPKAEVASKEKATSARSWTLGLSMFGGKKSKANEGKVSPDNSPVSTHDEAPDTYANVTGSGFTSV